ncbi:MAG: hypothetical protein V1782_03915, partial [Pseudomonadota bacterium]
MKKYACIQTMLVLVFLAGGCTLPPVHDPTPLRLDKKVKAETSRRPEKPAAAVSPETQRKRISLIPQNNGAQTTKDPAPDKD